MNFALKDEKSIQLKPHIKLFPKQKLGKGAFGGVYLGYDLKANQKVAIKEKDNDKYEGFLKRESQILKYFHNSKGIPELYDYFQIKSNNYMVYELLGLSLDDIFDDYHGKIPLRLIINIGKQLLSRIRYIHKYHIIHRDIKPSNFLIGRHTKKNLIYLVDFGLSKRYRNPKTGEHIPYKSGKASLTGTPMFASIYSHLGIEQSRRDDLESMCYVLIYFCRGGLPWKYVKSKNTNDKFDKILEQKMKIKIQDLCFGLPKEIAMLLGACRNLKFDEMPDYEYMKLLLNDVSNKIRAQVNAHILPYDNIYNNNINNNRYHYNNIDYHHHNNDDYLKYKKYKDNDERKNNENNNYNDETIFARQAKNIYGSTENIYINKHKNNNNNNYRKYKRNSFYLGNNNNEYNIENYLNNNRNINENDILNYLLSNKSNESKYSSYDNNNNDNEREQYDKCLIDNNYEKYKDIFENEIDDFDIFSEYNISKNINCDDEYTDNNNDSDYNNKSSQIMLDYFENLL